MTIKTAWWTHSVDTVCSLLQTSDHNGLSMEEGKKRVATYGLNQLQEKKGSSPIQIFLDQFKDFMIWVLIAAALISGFLGEWIDSAAIIAIVLINAFLGFIQEFKAEKSLAALKKLSSPNSKAIRDGNHHAIPSSELVPGDLIELEAGDNVPADSRVAWHTSNFSVQEASLTGESTAVAKHCQLIEKEETGIADRTNMVFMGTSVTMGKARCVVVETGMQTQLGTIAGLIQETKKETTPLQKKLEEFGRWLVYLCGILVGIVFILNLWRGMQETGALTKELFVNMFLTAVSLAVAAIPEGLPAVVTIALALGLQRMVKRHALIRKLPSVETLGSASVICSDKTGTLTRNEMTVQAVYASANQYTITGIGYSPKGQILLENNPVSLENHPDLKTALQWAALCNGAQLSEKEGKYSIVGDPTEGALLTVAAKAGIEKKACEQEYAFVDEIPFDSDRKLMTVICSHANTFRIITKGAPDILVGRCDRIVERGSIRPMTAQDRSRLLAVNDEYANRALRVLGVAYAAPEQKPGCIEADMVEKELIFVAFFAMIDPARDEVRPAIADCKTAGIKTVMITGDHKNTAVAIARSLQFYDDNSLSLTGEELNKLDDEAFEAVINRVSVYARVSPEHKLRIVKAWKKQGKVVAMTGDGVNDAPAVKEADIGVAMGITGTDVTKEVSDMVVTDDNFASIVAAVEEGRGIYENIKKFVHYLLSCNCGEILVMFIATLFGLPIPLLPIQILWVNLVTDGLPALALGVDPVEKDIMRRQPRSLGEKVIDRSGLIQILWQGFVIAMCSLGAFTFIYYCDKSFTLSDLFKAFTAHDYCSVKDFLSMPQHVQEALLDKARTYAFIILALSQSFQSFNCRSQTQSLFKIGVFSNKNLIYATLITTALNFFVLYNPLFQKILHIQPLHWEELLVIIAVSSIPLWIMESYKLVLRLRKQ
ncbi:MAG: cation-translocating P-type ATPase [Chitinivibrionales bacterium]|nr:cation-translocating P-type ATPase [Chitinivibrionales bacterium]